MNAGAIWRPLKKEKQKNEGGSWWRRTYSDRLADRKWREGKQSGTFTDRLWKKRNTNTTISIVATATAATNKTV